MNCEPKIKMSNAWFLFTAINSILYASHAICSNVWREKRLITTRTKKRKFHWKGWLGGYWTAFTTNTGLDWFFFWFFLFSSINLSNEATLLINACNNTWARFSCESNYNLWLYSGTFAVHRRHHAHHSIDHICIVLCDSRIYIEYAYNQCSTETNMLKENIPFCQWNGCLCMINSISKLYPCECTFASVRFVFLIQNAKCKSSFFEFIYAEQWICIVKSLIFPMPTDDDRATSIKHLYISHSNSHPG